MLGGLAGAVLGSQAASRGHRTDGSVLGAVVGATAGAMIARSNSRCQQTAQGRYDPYSQGPYARDPYAADPYGQAPYRDDSGLYGGPEPSGYGGNDYRRNGDCRMGQMITRDPYGREYREDVMMCRGRDGVWRPE